MRVWILKDGRELSTEASQGETVLQVIVRSGIGGFDAPCGGRGVCGKCRVQIDGQAQLACQTPVRPDMRVVLNPEENMSISDFGISQKFPLDPPVDLSGGEMVCGIAVDIGTTTLVARLYDLKSGKRLGSVSGANEQRAFGADVISRIQYTTDNGVESLSSVIRDQIAGMVRCLCHEAGVDTGAVKYVSAAGNTVMEHIFAGLSPKSIGVAPFATVSLFGEELQGRLLGDEFAQAAIYLAPAVAGYVGGDITAGLLASGAWKKEEQCLFIDIGTNGEMALGNKKGFVCCAVAAGPAFEGAQIEKGMSAVKGAINGVELKSGSLVCTTIEGAAAEGICGSGLVDALAVMLELGAVDETGKLLDSDEAPVEALPYLGLVNGESVFFLTKDHQVYITGSDVRKLQLAKAAIAAGIRVLTKEKGGGMDGISALYLAGGFGSYIRRESAVRIGMIPVEFLNKTVPVGNSACEGAVSALLSREAQSELLKIRDSCCYIELSSSAMFMDEYLAAMMFEDPSA